MTQKPESPPEIAYHGALIIIALLIVAVYVFAAALVRGHLMVLLPLLWGVWRVARRWPDMKLPLVFAFGLLGVLLAAGKLFLEASSNHAAFGVLGIAVVLIVLLLWLTPRRMSAREAAARTPPPAHREEPPNDGTSDK